MIRYLLVVLSVLCMADAHAQCCCGNAALDIRLDRPASHYTVNGNERGAHWNVDTVSHGVNMLHMRVRTGCGLESVTFTMHERWTGRNMEVELRNMSADMTEPTIRIPFTAGRYVFDHDHLGDCLAYGLRNNTGIWRDDKIFTDTIACNGGLLAVLDDAHLLEPLDLLVFQRMEEVPVPPQVRPAGYPVGAKDMTWWYRSHFDKALIERVNKRVKLSGIAMVEENGSVHEVHLNGSAYPELDAEFTRVLQQARFWTPAVVEGPSDPFGNRRFVTVEQGVLVEFTVDPKAVWNEIPEDVLTIGPVRPTSRDSIQLTLHWIGGSCGRYVSDAEVLRAMRDDTIRTVVLRFGSLFGPMCDDMAQQRWVHTLPPLPPGRYVLRRADFDDPALGQFRPDPYAVRLFEVLP